MNGELIEVVVSGSRAAAAADAVALGLRAAGAQVRCPDRRGAVPSSVAGLRAVVRLGGAPSPGGGAKAEAGTVSLVGAAKAMIGGVLLLALLGAEVRLHFGVRWDTFITLAGAWAFWRVCLRAK
jgi:hypothetical protein